MALAGEAAVAIWNDVEPGAREAFIDWHNREHIPERVGIAGFLRGRRMRVIGAGTEYFTLYEVENFAALTGAEYLARLDAPTAATRAMMPRMPNAARVLGRVGCSVGMGIGGFAATVRLAREPDERQTRMLAARAQGIAGQCADVLGLHLLLGDGAASGREIAEARHRRQPPSVPAAVIFVEGTDAARVCEAAARWIDGIGEAGPVASYALEICL